MEHVANTNRLGGILPLVQSLVFLKTPVRLYVPWIGVLLLLMLAGCRGAGARKERVTVESVAYAKSGRLCMWGGRNIDGDWISGTHDGLLSEGANICVHWSRHFGGWFIEPCEVRP